MLTSDDIARMAREKEDVRAIIDDWRGDPPEQVKKAVEMFANVWFTATSLAALMDAYGELQSKNSQLRATINQLQAELAARPER